MDDKPHTELVMLNLCYRLMLVLLLGILCILIVDYLMNK